jgi:hypothetical protein
VSFSSNKTSPNNIDLDSSQTLQNKTLDSTNDYSGDIINPSRLDVKQDTFSNLETYASTASNGQIVYATDVKKMYQVIDSALTEVGSGSGGINYITNPDMEVNVADWTGDTNLAVSQETVSPLRGSGSLKIAKTLTADTQSVTIPFTIDSADLAKKLTISFDKDFSHPAYADGDAQVRIIKDPAVSPVTIRVNGEDIKAGKASHIAQFQTDATELDYALEIYWVDTASSSVDVYMDNVQVGPREVAKGAAMTDAKSYTPSLNGLSFSGLSTNYYRIGEYLHVEGTAYTGGSITANTANIELPAGLIIDSNQANQFVLGTLTRGVASGTTNDFRIISDGNTDKVGITVVNNGSLSGLSGRNWNDILGASNQFSWEFKVKIQGWSSDAVMSEDLGQREIVAIYGDGASQSIGASSTILDFRTKYTDSTASVTTGASWNFTAPETGYYNISGTVSVDITTAFNGTTERLFVNAFVDGNVYSPLGTVEQILAMDTPESGTFHKYYPFGRTIYLEKGQVFDVRAYQESGSNHNFLARSIHIVKLASPQTILETETVAARYTTDAGQSINHNTYTIVDYEDKSFDTHGTNMVSGTYTVPVTGLYDIKATATWGSLNVAAGKNGLIRIRVNGNNYKINWFEFQATAALTYTTTISDIAQLNKGDTVAIQVYQDSGAAEALETLGETNVFSIKRIK